MGQMLPKPVTTKVVERKGNKRFRVGVSCMNGFRERMEDDHTIELHDEWGFFAVFDGHVGPACAEFMAKAFPERLRNMTIPVSDEDLTKLSLDLDREFLATQSEDGSTGTYFTAIPIADGKYTLQVGNVGDSRVIVGKGGVAHPMTTDHKPTNEEEKQRIELAGGHVTSNRVDGRLAVSRAYGDVEYKKGDDNTKHKVIAVPQITYTEVGPADFVFLSCDGVFESHFTNEEVIEFVHNKLKTTNDLTEVASAVCHEALERGSRDNISAMIVQFADGTDYQNLAEQKELILGPFSSPESTLFTTAYKGMIHPLTFHAAIEKRFDYAVELLEKRIAFTKTTDKGCDLSTLDDTELRKLLISLSTGQDYPSLVAFSRQELMRAVEQRKAEKTIIPLDIIELREEISSYNIEGVVPPKISDEVARKEWFRNFVELMEQREKPDPPPSQVALLAQLLMNQGNK
eukprot:TRINITY_DN2543_c0_g1_i2.p1 TRINITY_DN2543_c0_g1~~TRINITY_DN2543_c0_g1_i2.p1  ORF type:complete len:458 (+),score=114.64 TRINITY_DN2543_c0_g1_i2:45-1418(+)